MYIFMYCSGQTTPETIVLRSVKNLDLKDVLGLLKQGTLV